MPDVLVVFEGDRVKEPVSEYSFCRQDWIKWNITLETV